MSDRVIEQALFESGQSVAHSPGLGELRVAELANRLADYGTLDGDTEALFATILSDYSTAVVQVLGGRARALVLRPALWRVLHDPFRVAKRYPPNWADRGPLTELVWADGPPPPRTLGQLRAVLQEGEGPVLLGAAQCVIDGGYVGLESTTPDASTVEQVWMLLPDSVRAETAMATFAPRPVDFRLAATPSAGKPEFAHYLTREQCADYPEGCYELSLQVAVETGDEAAVERLLGRRSSRQALRLMLLIFALALIIGLTMRFLPVGPGK